MKLYPKYKDTQSCTIGKIPIQWQVLKLKYNDIVEMGQSPNSDDYNNVESGYPFLQGNADFGELFPKPFIWCETARKVARCNDILFSVRAPIGAINIANREYGIGRGLCAIRSKKSYFKYLYYLLQTLRIDLQSIGTGSTYTAVSTEDVGNLTICLPTYFEQQLIANYLDKKTDQIDKLIEQKETLIELLQEEKTAIVNQAITKGLNKDVKLKDSGIEWLGEIPEHWKLKKIKYTSYVKARVGWKGLTSSDFELNSDAYLITGTDFKGKEINWEFCYQVNNFWYENDPYIQLMENDLLITKDGTIGKIALVKNMPKKTTLNSGVFVVRPLKDFYLTEYLYWLLNSSIFDNFIKFIKTGSTINHLYQDVFENFQTPLPNIDEQLMIIDYLDTETNKVNNTISKIEREIELLHEYREALISEAVTGKIDVRGEL